jgi:hypothetical protein
VSLPLITSETNWQIFFIKFIKRNQAIECYVILFNPVSSTIQNWQTFRLLRWLQNLHQSAWNHDILDADRYLKKWTLSKTIFVKIKTAYSEGGWNINFRFCLTETTHEPLYSYNEDWYSKRSKMCLQVVFELLFCLTKLLHMGTERNVEVMFGKTLKHCM